MAYNVGPKDRHRLGVHTDILLLSVFSPPLMGDEQHDENGTLAPSGPVPQGPRLPMRCKVRNQRMSHMQPAVREIQYAKLGNA